MITKTVRSRTIIINISTMKRSIPPLDLKGSQYKLWKLLHYRLHCSCFNVSSHFLHSILHCSCFISFPSVHTSLVMFHFYFLQSTVRLIHFIYHSPSHSSLPYLVALILHSHSTLLLVSLFNQYSLWKLTTYECL